ncbi:uncharacterized protein [Castor canadensis]|uniref:Uncharacterized protein n=1 Tax=Castor canadensis TaxID=51338 RepID=A0AC58MG77_CASCN
MVKKGEGGCLLPPAASQPVLPRVRILLGASVELLTVPCDAKPRGRGTGRDTPPSQTSVPELATPPREGEERGRRRPALLWGAGALRWQRVNGPVAGQVRSRAGHRISGASPLPSPTLWSSECPSALETPFPASLPHWAARLGLRVLARRSRSAGGHRDPSSSFAPVRRGPHSRCSSEPVVEAPPGKGFSFLSTLLREDSGTGRKCLERTACAFADRPRFAGEKQLPPKSCLPLPPKAPLRRSKERSLPKDWKSYKRLSRGVAATVFVKGGRDLEDQVSRPAWRVSIYLHFHTAYCLLSK